MAVRVPYDRPGFVLWTGVVNSLAGLVGRLRLRCLLERPVFQHATMSGLHLPGDEGEGAEDGPEDGQLIPAIQGDRYPDEPEPCARHPQEGPARCPWRR